VSLVAPSDRAPEPLGPRRLNFVDLHEDDFEELAYLVILLDHPNAIRLHAPDDGADAAEFDGSAYTRCWQSKRFTGSV
jgi:predicted dienelactone hydrolase